MKKSIFNLLAKLTVICFALLPAAVTLAFPAPENIQVTGHVSDENGEPLVGVTIQIKNMNAGALSDINGDYTIKVPSEKSVLVFQSLGYETQEVAVGSRRIIDVTLLNDTEALNEVVVVGYGTQTKTTVVSSVESIKPETLKMTGSTLSTSFAGRLSGVISYQRSGQPGADGATVLIRGFASPNSSSPLVIIDGIQQDMQELNYLDPAVIKDFSVLKDASATALYGTLGANGVILVNTKLGDQMKKPRITVRMEERMQTPVQDINYVDGVNFMTLYNEAIQHPNSATAASSGYSEEKIYMTRHGGDPLVYPNVDWKKECLKQWSHNQRAVVDIEGGSSRITYFSSLSFIHEGGLIRNRTPEYRSFDNNIDYYTYVLKNNFGINLTPTTKLDSRLSVRLFTGTSPNTRIWNVFNYVRRSNPVDFPIMFDKTDPKAMYLDGKQGDIQDFQHYLWGGNQYTPNAVAELTDGFQSHFESTVNANVDLNQKLDFFTEGLSAKLSFNFKNNSYSQSNRGIGYNRYYIKSTRLDPDAELASYSLQRSNSDVIAETFNTTNSSSGSHEIYLQGLINYSRQFVKAHDVNAMLMYNQIEWRDNNPSGLYASLPKRKQQFSGRFTYSFRKKYNLEANFGATGSENFAKGHRWGFFPSVGASYVLSEEGYWSALKNAVPFFKLRFSRGLSGNDYIAGDQRFAFQEDLALGSLGYATGKNNSNAYKRWGPKYNRFRNENLTWEVSDKMNFGVDFNITNAIEVQVDAFKELRKNVFLSRATVPGFIGLTGTTILTNLGKVSNHGIDASVSYFKEFGKDFSVNLRGTFTYAHNEYVAWDEPDWVEYASQSRIGQPLDRMTMLQADGLIRTQEEADAVVNGFSSIVGIGDIKYIDQLNVNGEADGIIDDKDYIYYGYPTTPEIVYGLSTDFKFKGFSLSLLFQGQERVALMATNFLDYFGQERKNIPTFIARDYFSLEKQNFDAEYPRLSAIQSSYNSRYSTHYYRNARFLKLKYAELGYDFNRYYVFAAGNNLLTFAPFKHWDPERGGGVTNQYPTMMTFQLGLKIKFNY